MRRIDIYRAMMKQMAIKLAGNGHVAWLHQLYRDNDISPPAFIKREPSKAKGTEAPHG